MVKTGEKSFSSALTFDTEDSSMVSFAQDDQELHDELIMEKMGYKKELFRGLTAFSNFAFGFTEVAILASFTSMYGFGLNTGGPSVILFGFLITFACTMIVALSLAEICAAYPSAGSVYHWTAQLVPLKYATIASYICGWCNFIGNAAGDASFGAAFSEFLDAAIISSGGNELGNNMKVLCSIVACLIWSLLNFLRVDQVGWFNNLAAFCHTSTILLLLVVLFSVPDKLNTFEFVTTKYVNNTGFTNDTYVCFMGLLTAMFSFAGYEASAHMAEETHGAASSAPNGIIYTCFATGIGGVILILALLYSTTNLEVSLNGLTGNVAIDSISTSCGEVWGEVFAWLILLNLFFAGISSVAVTARITFALMRDNAFPYSDYFRQVHDKLKSPIRAIMFVFATNFLILLLPLSETAGAIAFYTIVGLSTVGFQFSYCIPIALKLYFSDFPFPETPKSLGNWSNVCGWISCIWLSGSSILFFLPTDAPGTGDTMNWLFLAFIILLILGSLNWHYNSKYSFKGPKRSDSDAH